MKRGSGVKDRDDRSSGIEIRMPDALAKIKPVNTDVSTATGMKAIGSGRLMYSCL